MDSFFTPLPIIIATIAGFCVGAVWYSPLLFLTTWLRGEGLTKDQIPKRSLAYVIQTHVYAFIGHGVIVAVLAVIFDLLQIQTMKVAISLSLLLAIGFIVSTRFIEMVYNVQRKHYEMRSQIKFLLFSAYYCTVVAVMSSVLFLIVSS